MISPQAAKFFAEFRDTANNKHAQSDFKTFDLAAERSNAAAAGNIASEPNNVTIDEVYVQGVRNLRITPANASANQQLIFIHGGAFALMSPETYQRLVGHIALACRCQAYIPEYSLAPENPFPCALNEVRDFISYALEQASNENIKTALIGESAGGALALGSTIDLRNKRLPLPSCLVLISPWLDMSLSGNSNIENDGKDIILSRDNMHLFTRYYLENTGFEASDPLVSPLFDKLAGLPAIYCQSAEFDLVRDDAVRLSNRLTAENEPIKLEIFAGMCHSFQFFVGQFPEASDAIKKLGAFVKNQLG